jgi:hypothetical protein
MKINEFRIDASVDLGERSQMLRIVAELAPAAEPERVDVLRSVIRNFAAAGELGMFCGAAADPAAAAMEVVEEPPSRALHPFQLRLTNIPVTSCRVLIGMLRGSVMLDRQLLGLTIRTGSPPPGRRVVTINDENELSLPRLTEKLSFAYLPPRSDLIRSSDRGVRITFAEALKPEDVEALLSIQAVWDAVCEGGCCSSDVHAVECGIFASPGLAVTANAFEIKIGVFRNSEICFEYLANAAERFSRMVRRVESMEVW